MVFLLGLYGGGSRRRATAKGGAVGSRRRSSSAVAAPRPVRQLYWKLRSRLRPKRRHAVVARFGYDLQSYSRNFDDGIVVSGGPATGASRAPDSCS